jgi:MoaA/NifB/PqqE/SkfB family radical SAM enzyme
VLAALAPDRFRRFPLDGAVLYFDPSTGTNVRLESARTRAHRRQAPRVAMFGITNACNLACDFCSRDLERASGWTVESAAAVLRGLSRAGTLEVAFGGGEPFAFRGFAELVTELRATTPLAVHVTTNGTLLTRERWRSFEGLFGQVRVSIYDDSRWRDGVRTLAEREQLWGANVIVDPAALVDLDARLNELRDLGCHDVSLLAYVGPDRDKHLDRAARARLASIVNDAPLACRLSVCFGDRVPVSRLFDGADGSGDCGAGIDFVSITPDRRVQGCSFQGGGLPGRTAGEVLDAWRIGRARMLQPAWRDGCARSLPAAGREPSRVPPIAIWRAFSGNNSGECVLVARFESREAAERYLAELAPGLAMDQQFSEEWKRLFIAEGVVDEARAGLDEDGDWSESPTELVAIGRTVAALGYAAGDAFAPLRALAWKRSGRVIPGGVHLHERPSLLFAVRAKDPRALGSPHPTARRFVHGDALLSIVPLGRAPDTPRTLEDARALVAGFAGGRPFDVELLFDEPSDEAVVEVLKHLGSEIARAPRLAAWFRGPDSESEARRFAASIQEARSTVAGSLVLFDPLERPKRIAVLAYRAGGDVAAIETRQARVHATLWRHVPYTKGKRPEVPSIDLERIASALDVVPGAKEPRVELRRPDYAGASVRTEDPATVLRALESIAAEQGLRLSVGVGDLDPLALAIRRVLAR